MDAAGLVRALEGFSSPHEIRESPRLDEILAALPSRPQDYVEIAQELYSGLTVEDLWGLDNDMPDRLISALTLLLYHDGRSLLALLWIVDWASSSIGFSELGVSPLAAISNACSRTPLPVLTDEETLARAETWAKVEALKHNADACRYWILLRRPDLES